MYIFNLKPLNKSKFEKIYEKNFEKIYRFYILRSLSKEVAEDLTSSTFLAFAEQMELLNDPNTKEKKDKKKKKKKDKKKIDKPENYLYGIAKIKFIEHLKLKYTEVPLELENISIADEVETAVKTTTNLEYLSDYLYQLINKLPRKQKLIMKLRIIDKFKLSEVAETLGKDLNYVKTTQKRAIRKLKELAAKMYT